MVEPRRIRVKTWAVLLTVAIGAAASGYGAAQLLKSPEQKAAEAQAPEPSVITVPLERKQLVDAVTWWCDPGRSQDQVVQFPTEPGDVRQIVTESRSTADGGEFGSGDLVLAINGKPRFVIELEVPLYRDIHVGDSGPDVASFAHSLRELGFVVPESSVADADFFSVAKMFYAKRGYVLEIESGLPARDFIAIQGATALIDRALPPVGADATAIQITASSGAAGLRCEFDTSSAPQGVIAGSTAIVHIDGEDIRAVTADVSATSNSPAEGTDDSEGSGGTASAFVALPAGQEQPLVSVEVDFVLEETEQKVLVAPAAAIWQKGNSTYVTVVEQDGQKDVEVTIGLSSAGQAEIAAVSGTLSEGDRLVVGA